MSDEPRVAWETHNEPLTDSEYADWLRSHAIMGVEWVVPRRYEGDPPYTLRNCLQEVHEDAEGRPYVVIGRYMITELPVAPLASPAANWAPPAGL